MWTDPIVSETRLLREQFAKQFGHNADAIFSDILRRQIASGRKLVSFKPRKPAVLRRATRKNDSVGAGEANPRTHA